MPQEEQGRRPSGPVRLTGQRLLIKVVFIQIIDQLLGAITIQKLLQTMKTCSNKEEIGLHP